MKKVRRFYRDEEINSWIFDSEEEAQKYTDERLNNILEGYVDEIIFTREEA